MEILENNQKKSARIRMWGFICFATALAFTFLVSTHQEYTGFGQKELMVLQQEIENDLTARKKRRKELELKITKTKEALKTCENDANPEKKLQACMAEIDIKDDEIGTLTQDLQMCESKLQAAIR